MSFKSGAALGNKVAAPEPHRAIKLLSLVPRNTQSRLHLYNLLFTSICDDSPAQYSQPNRNQFRPIREYTNKVLNYSIKGEVYSLVDLAASKPRLEPLSFAFNELV